MPNRVNLEQSGIEISEEMQARIDKIANTENYNRPKFSQEQDAILLKYWKVKNKQELSNILGVSQTTARKRYRELTDE